MLKKSHVILFALKTHAILHSKQPFESQLIHCGKVRISSYQGNNTNKTAVNCSLHYSFNKMLIDRKAHISCYWYTDLNWHPGWEGILSTCLLPRDFPQHTASQRTVFTLFSHQWEGARSKGDLSDEPWLVWQSRL